MYTFLLQFLLKTKQTQESGFSLVVALGLGLFMVVTGATMILRSNDDQVASTLQQHNLENIAIAEAGLNRVLGVLRSDNNSLFLKLDYDPNNLLGSGINEWEDAAYADKRVLKTSVFDGGCSGNSGDVEVSVPSGLTANSTGDGNYELLAYDYNPQTNTGTFIVEGEFQDAQGNATQGTARLQASIYVDNYLDEVPTSFPGLFMENVIELGNNDISLIPNVSADPNEKSSVICAQCKFDTDKENACAVGISEADYQGYIHTDAMGGKSNSTLTNVIPRLGRPNLPDLPVAPQTITADLGNSAVDLPRDGDQTVSFDPDGAGPAQAYQAYVYKAGNLNVGKDGEKGGGQDKDWTIKTTNAPVIVFLSGDLTISGSRRIVHEGDFGDFAIFGKPDSGTGTASQNIRINGTASSTFFVYAPDAQVGINGGGNGDGMTGVIWGKIWDASSSNASGAVVNIPPGAPQALGNTFGMTFENVSLYTEKFQNSGVVEWERQEVTSLPQRTTN
ncbi:hypothetical protein FEK30_12290 [Picosynechococcus sp. PCC 11901]|uniref:hypothetical protein n=1 Tax=Picosynechococcus sp. PCC 11901 TaxID=2579791 RepID=UPI0010FBC768|nr:hypothetical protein [Picosynechococcus sp. PCC 11901]QCS50142.1 hypothetical protein FEK30_12290 [Picosynechococcus sp. PCC 11901]